jgi:UDP-N-acetylmuramoyl-tripeptide--D-alanyl-D-alanine ligase
MDDARYDLLRSQSGVPVFTVSLHDNNADFYGEIRDLLQGRLQVTERCSRATVELESGLPGEYNATNLLLAFAAARSAGVAAEVAASALSTLAVPSMRWQSVKMENSVEIVNDAYNANPESVKAVLNVFARMKCDGRRIVVLGDMLELGGFTPQFHRDVGADAAASAPDLLCLVGEFSSKHTAEGALDAGFDRERLLLFDDAVAAANQLKAMARSGDLILLKGSRGMMLERVVNQMRC